MSKIVEREVAFSSRHRTYSIKVEEPSEPADKFEICFGILFPST